jgi:hypothetical protein
MPPFTDRLEKFWKRLNAPWRFALAAFLIARLLYAAWSWVVFTMQPVAIQNFELRGEPILSIFRLEDSLSRVYLREVDGELLTFQPAGPDVIVDRESGSLWSISKGEGIDGPYRYMTLASASETSASDLFPYQNVLPYPNRWLSVWQRFDANIYLSIAERGYGNIPGDTHFPPLYPLLIRLLAPFFGNAFLAALFVSHLATLYMLKLLYDVFVQWGGLETGRRAVLFFIIYPASFFFFSAYSEPVFIVTCLLSLRSMRTRSWAWAGFWTFCAILTRLQGAALLVPMLYLMQSDAPFLRRSMHWAGLALAGFGGLFYLYLRSAEGSGHILPVVESEWQARLALPGETYLYAIRTMLAGSASFIDILNFGVATLFVILIIAGWKKIPLEYNLYMLVNLFIISIRVVETQPLNSMSRFALTLFPAFYTLGLAGVHPLAKRVILYIFLPLNLYLSGQFFLWGWVA